MTVWIMEATKESSPLEKALNSPLNQVSTRVSQTKSMNAIKVQTRVNAKKFTNHFLCGIFLPFIYEPTELLLVMPLAVLSPDRHFPLLDIGKLNI